MGQNEDQMQTPKAQWRLREWFPDLPPETHEMLRVYYAELLKFNPKINLISRRTELDADQVHFADSIMASKILLQHTKSSSIVDIGSGNGFPGLVLATLAPDRQILLLDKDLRKIEFIKHVVGRMGLKNVSTYNGLLETIKPESIQCGISRGFASITGAIIGARKSFKPGGEYFHMKSNAWVREIAEIPTQVCSIWSPKLVADYRLPASTVTMSLILTRKIG